MRLNACKPTTDLSLPTKWETVKRNRSPCLKRCWLSQTHGTRKFGHSHRGITARLNAVTARIMSTFMLIISFIHARIFKNSWPFISAAITISLCVLSTGALRNRSYLLFQICNTSLTNLHEKWELLPKKARFWQRNFEKNADSSKTGCY